MLPSSDKDGAKPGRGRPRDSRPGKAAAKQGAPRSQRQVEARTVAGAVVGRVRMAQEGAPPASPWGGRRMEAAVWVSIGVSNARLDGGPGAEGGLLQVADV